MSKLRSTILASAITVGATIAHAQQDSALLDLLVKKKVITQQEAVSVQTELEKEQAAAASKMSASKIKLSDSITEMRIYGEGRLRYFVNQGEAAGPGLDAGDHAERYRLRYRLRLGADIKFMDNWMLGVLLETNNSARSANVTLGENPFFGKATVTRSDFISTFQENPGTFVTGFDKNGKPVTGRAVTGVTTRKGAVVTNVNFGDDLFVGRLFLKYNPWEWVTLTGGKIPNPFVTTRMVWDPDINPEGFAEQFKLTIGPWGGSSVTEGYSKDGKEIVATKSESHGMTIDLFANFGQFIYDDVGFENSFNSGNGPFSTIPNKTDRWMLGWQLGARANFNKSTYFQIAPTLYNYTGGGLSSAGPFNGDSPLVILNDNSEFELVTFNQTGTNDLTILDIPVEFGFKVGNVPVSIFGDFAKNLDSKQRAAHAGHPDKNNGIAWMAGAGIGQARKRGDIEVRGWYQNSGAYALDQNIIDDDIFDGRLNMKGFFVQGTYMLTDFASIIVQYSHGRRIDDDLGTPGFGALGTPAGFPLEETNLLYLDLNLRF